MGHSYFRILVDVTSFDDGVSKQIRKEAGGKFSTEPLGHLLEKAIRDGDVEIDAAGSVEDHGHNESLEDR